MLRIIMTCLMVFAAPGPRLSATELSGIAERVSIAGYEVRKVSVSLTDGLTSLQVSADAIAGRERVLLQSPALECQGFLITANAVRCDHARVSASTGGPVEQLRWEGRLHLDRISQALNMEGSLSLLGLTLPLSVRYSPDHGLNATAKVNAVALKPLVTAMRVPSDLALQRGRFSGTVQVSANAGGDWRGQIDGGLAGVDFDTRDGYTAGAELGVRLRADLGPAGEGWEIGLSAERFSGELLVGDFYTDLGATALALEAKVDWRPEGFRIHELSLTDGASLQLAGQAAFRREPLSLERLGLQRVAVAFPAVYQRYLASLLAVWTLGDLETSGQIAGTASWDRQTGWNADLALDRVAIRDRAGRFGISGFNGRLVSAANAPPSALSWQELDFYRIPIGPTNLALRFGRDSLALTEPLHLPLLGGEVGVDEFVLIRPASQDRSLRLKARVVDVGMAELSAALAWPPLGGTLSGDIPSVHLKDDVLSLDGALEFRVFDGLMRAESLSVERPFGVLPTVAGSIHIEQLDLEQLTGAFSFGKIEGRLDGAIEELRLLDWRPVAFDAWFQNSAGATGPKRISQRAVQNIAAIGSGGAVTALSGAVLNVFDDFRYRRLGIRCRLQNNICHMSGIDSNQTPFVIVQGAGLPRINVLGYNPNVDWPQLIAELKAATRGPGISFEDG